MTLSDLLTQYPWDTKYAKDKKLDFLWEFSLNVPREKIWPLLIDTSSFNKMLGLPEMKYREENGVLHGESVNAGMKLAWTEVPWEWSYLQGLNTARVYERGFAKFVRSRYILEETSPETCTLYVYFSWVPRGLLGNLILSVGMKRLKKGYQRVLQELVKSILETDNAETAKEKQRITPIEVAPEIHTMVRELKKEAVNLGANEQILDKLIKYLFQASEEELYRIRLKSLAEKLKVPFEDLLETALLATKSELLLMSYDVLCPHCRGVRQEVKNIGDLPKEASCEPCQVRFGTGGKNNIEIIFRPNPALRKAEKRFFCAAEPATKQHIYIQRHIAPKEVLTLPTNLPEGLYKMRFVGENKMHPLHVKVTNSLEPSTQRAFFPPPMESVQEVPDHPVLVIENKDEKMRTFVLERDKLDETALRPAELFNLQLFRDLYDAEAIPEGLSLEVGVQTILFTDIVGSTSYYKEVGDAQAFQAVRDHFVEIFTIAREFHGAVVKTIGDSAMLSFSRRKDALNAALEIQNRFVPGNKIGLKLRVSLHTGECLAVHLNSNIDYFGNTVNLAAKMQKYANEHEIVISWPLKERAQEIWSGIPIETVKSDITALPELYRIRVLAPVARPVLA